MLQPAPDAAAFREHLSGPLDELVESHGYGNRAARPADSTPADLAEAFTQLIEVMQRTERGLAEDQPGQPGRASGEQVSEIGEYALELFEQALGWANDLDLPEVFETFQVAMINMSRWIARHGGELFRLEAVVDALAREANRIQEPRELLDLYGVMGEIIDATTSAIRQDLEKTNPGRPWRVLHLNRGIVATRTHQPDVMEEAFASLVERLPEDAPGFFSQGMEQMDLLNYPPHVREVMDRYYRKWSVNRSLH
jgi:hypothetical protein